MIANRVARAPRKNTEAEIKELVHSCMPLVLQISRGMGVAGLEHDDLVAAGNLGLVEAAHRFDKKRGFKFTTYAAYWIRAMMFLTLERAGGKRLNRDERRAFYHVKRARKALGMDATDVEIAAFLGIDVAAVEALSARRTFSLDAKLPPSLWGQRSEADEVSWINRVADDRAEQADESIEESERERAVRDALECLDPRERRVVRDRFFRDPPLKLQELGNAMGVSRERVRQLELRALSKLRQALDGGAG